MVLFAQTEQGASKGPFGQPGQPGKLGKLGKQELVLASLHAERQVEEKPLRGWGWGAWWMSPHNMQELG